MRLSKNTKGSEAEGRMQRLTNVKELVKKRPGKETEGEVRGAGGKPGIVASLIIKKETVSSSRK